MSDPLAVIAGLPGVSEAVQDARAAVDRLYGHRVLRRRGPEVSAESALRGARASAALEGADISLESFRSGAAGSPVAQGALRASSEVGRLGPTWRTAPRQVLARLHALAAADLLGAPAPGSTADDVLGTAMSDVPGAAPSGGPRAGASDLLGRPRTGAATSDLLGIGPAPGAEAAAARIASLVTLITTPSKAPALLLAAIVHAELVVLRPFGTADGLVARAAERLTLVEFGLDPKSLVVVEVGHAALGDAYAESLRGYLKGTAEGVSGWVRHCATAVELGARETLAICEALQRG
ncbi:Fic family protein [Sphaerisporangium corydalis]|uniref:Oxidoreductase n=1 Tax=Sphaerisporangium corydalis TaxID=1441875 RepID=A0ABV9EKE7_9ACTN|nr:oxidoreductase [Sphaerisporangium corydalis]